MLFEAQRHDFVVETHDATREVAEAHRFARNTQCRPERPFGCAKFERKNALLTFIHEKRLESDEEDPNRGVLSSLVDRDQGPEVTRGRNQWRLEVRRNFFWTSDHS